MYVRMDRYDVSIVTMPPACLFWPCLRLVNLVYCSVENNVKTPTIRLSFAGLTPKKDFAIFKISIGSKPA
jgi:hypothetical protein